MKTIYYAIKTCLFHACLFIILAGTDNLRAATFTTIADGNWSSAATWMGGSVPGSTISATDTVNIEHIVTYNLSNDLEVFGTVNITNGTFRTALTGDGMNKSVFIKSGGSWIMCNAQMFLPIFNCGYGCSTGANLSGNFKNEGGEIFIFRSNVEIAQNWEDVSSPGAGMRSFVDGCLKVGENFSNKGAVDLYDSTCVEIGLHGSGNWENEYLQTFQHSTTIKLVGSSGNVKNSASSPQGVLGGPGFPDIAVFGINNGNMTNDGPWSASVLNFCIDGGSVGGSMAADFIADVTNNDTPAACAAVDTTECGPCPLGECMLEVTASVVSPVTCDGGGSDGSVTVTVTPGTATTSCAGADTITYLWNSVPPQTTQTAINLPPGTYTVTVTDASGCTATASITLEAPTNCCELIITCPPSNGGVFDCIEDVPAPDTNLVIVLDSCDVVTTTVEDDTTGTGCGADTMFIVRSYFVDDGTNLDTCTQVFKVVDDQAPAITCPTVTSPIECPATPTFPPASASDNCDASVSITFVDVTTPSGICPQEYSITRTWTATDDCQNSSSCSRTIAVTDNTAPVITCPTVTTPIECPATPTFPPATATDLCDASVTITFADVTTPSGICPQEYSVTRTWTATDDCLNSSTCSRTIAVTDNAAPVITCPSVTTPIECPATPVFPPATASDLCDASVTITFVDVTTPSGICPQEYSVTRTWTATDDCLNSSTCSRTIAVTDNTPPVITCPTVVSPIECPATPVFPPATATDICDASVTITFVDVTTPSGICSQEFSVTRTWTATDDCGNSATCSRTVVVTDNGAPLITCPPVTSPIECPATPTFPTPTSTDICDANVTITFVDVTTPSGICPQEYSVTRTWTATDDCGNSSTCSQTIAVTDNTAPVITCPTVPSSVECPATPTFPSATATDACDVSVSITFADITTPGVCPQEYSVTRTWTATDDCLNSSACSRTIAVTDNTGPVITCPTVTTPIECPATPVFPPATASDLCDATLTITFVDITTPSGICLQEYSVTRTWTATDDCLNSSTCSRTIAVTDNTAPVITCPTVVSPIECPATPVFPPATASDLCDATVTITFVDVTTPSGICSQEYSVTRTWTATDDCGNSATCSRTIAVTDNTPPVITCPTVISPIVCPATPTFPPATATDACDASVSITFTDTTTPGICLQEYSVTRTWTATDDCLNSSTCSRTVAVIDNGTPPVITCPPVTSPIECPATPTFPPPTATDICDASVTITFIDVTTPSGICPQEYSVTRTWTATDDCGGSSTCSQTIAVTDNTAPVITCPTVTTPIECPATPTFLPATASDACDPSVTITFADVTTPGACPQEYSVTRTWTATDDCSNSSTCSRTISVTDNTPPAITCPPDTIINFGDDTSPGNTGTPTVVDICDGQPTFTSADVTIAGACEFEYTILRTWTATDACGNSATCLQTIEVDGECCEVPDPVILGDSVVCPGDTVIYSVEEYNPDNTYNWNLSGGGIIIANTDSTITVVWQDETGGPFEISLTEIAGPGCQATAFLNVIIHGDEALACDDLVHISLDGDCEFVMLAGMILEGEQFSDDNYIVIVIDQNGDTLPNATITVDQVGQILIVKVMSECNNNSCWGTILVEDKIPPQIVCDCPVGGPPDTACQVTCLDVDQLEDGIIPPDLQPEATDNCGVVSIEIINTETNFDPCEGGYIRVTWLVTDVGGNTASCVQEFTIIPLTLDSLVCPLPHEGICGGSVHPDDTGWPQIDGINLNDEGGLCNIFTGYWDKELNECGGGRKIVRTWTILDWCTLEIVECVQVIKLADNEGPDLTCPANITVGTDFWYCYANVSVPKPIASDECSDVTIYALTSSSGTIHHFGGNNFIINGLLPGTHTVTWTVTDECGNSSTCSFTITVKDNVVPVANCDEHTIVSLTNDGPFGLTLVPATVFDDGSYDNCGPVTFRARRMDSCIDFDWTTEGACEDHIPNGQVNSRDRGTIHRSCVPFACCDVGAGPVMVELEVTDVAGNVNYCMIEAEIQDKITPFVICPPDIIVSCEFWFPLEEGTFVDADGNDNGSLDEDPLSHIFGNMFDAFRHHENDRHNIIIHDPGNHGIPQPYNWGLDGWADDNCEVNLSVRVTLLSDCSGDNLPNDAPDGAVKLIERRFTATDGSSIGSGVCRQRIWVVDFNPFYISDQTCHNSNPNDGVIWPCDVILTTCPDDLTGTGEPIIFDDVCSLIGISYEDTRFDFVDGACFKILREWKIIDWCQYDPNTGYGLWEYTQVIKIHDGEGAKFLDCPIGPVVKCVADEGISLPASNQAFVGENAPNASSCSVHVRLKHRIREACGDIVHYDVKLYPFNGSTFIQIKPRSTAVIDENNEGEIYFDTEESSIQSIKKDGLPYNSPLCGNYHRVLWSVEAGCGKWSHCEYLLRLEDCKQPSPVCINGLSTVVMPLGGQVTIWAKDFNASSFDDCAPAVDLLYSFSGDSYQPSFTYTCDNVPAFGVELSTNIWVADGGVDHNCNGQIEWSERNKDFCTTTIVINDNAEVCDTNGSKLAGEILTPGTDAVSKVKVTLLSSGSHFPDIITETEGRFLFNHLQAGQDYTISTERNDNHKNGVSTLDLVRIQKHLLGRQFFTSPYQYLAADANNNQNVSAIDLIELRKLILGIYNELPHNKSWRFVDKKFVMDDPDHPWPFKEFISIEQLAGSIYDNDFFGVKVGDVNNTAQANAFQIQPRKGNRVMHINASVKEDVEAGEIIEMLLTIPETVSGFQWTLEADDLEYAGISSEDIVIDDHHVGVLGKGIVTMSWNNAGEKENAGQNVITLRINWKVSKSGKVSEMIRLTDLVTQAESYTPEGEVLDVKLSFAGHHSNEFALYQNKPNPWNGHTTIGFDLPADANVILTIYDVNGKTIKTVDGEFKAGYNSITLTTKDIPATGVMYYRLDSDGYSASKKMVMIR